MSKWNDPTGVMYGGGRVWRLRNGREVVIIYLGRDKYALVCVAGGVALALPEGSAFTIEKLPALLKSAQYLGEARAVTLQESE